MEEKEILDRTIKVKSQTNLINTEKIAAEYEDVIEDLKKERDELARRLKVAEAQKSRKICCFGCLIMLFGSLAVVEERNKVEQKQREREINEVNDLRQKLKNSIKMGNEFKIALEGKDAQIERLLASIEEYRRETVTLRAQLDAARNQADRSTEIDNIIKKLEKEVGYYTIICCLRSLEQGTEIRLE